MNKIREKTTATLLTAVFVISIFAVAMPVNADGGPWWVPANLADGNKYNDVEAWIRRTDESESVEFKVEIVSENVSHGVYGMGIVISSDINTIDFQVCYAEYLGSGADWYYQEYGTGWGSVSEVLLTDSGTGITATGQGAPSPGEKIFTVDIPVELLGGYGAKYYYAIQFRTNLLGTFPYGLDLLAQEDAAKFIPGTTVPEPGVLIIDGIMTEGEWGEVDFTIPSFVDHKVYVLNDLDYLYVAFVGEPGADYAVYGETRICVYPGDDYAGECWAYRTWGPYLTYYTTHHIQPPIVTDGEQSPSTTSVLAVHVNVMEWKIPLDEFSAKPGDTIVFDLYSFMWGFSDEETSWIYEVYYTLWAPTISEAIDDIEETVDPRVANSLISKLENALKAQDRGNIKAFENILNAFINQVEAQSGKKIPSDYAEILIAWAEDWTGS